MASKTSQDPLTFDFLFHVILAWLLLKVQVFFLYISGTTYRNARAGRPIQRLKVSPARRLEFMTSCADFFTLHDGFISADYLRRDTVSLYTMDAANMYFVEVPEDVDIYNSNTNPFIFNAQYDHAVHLIRTPLAEFVRFADSLSSGDTPVILLSNTGRCGSTILTQMFEKTGRILTLSEPDAMAKIFDYPKLYKTEILTAMFKVMTKPRQRQPIAYVIKPKSQCVCQVSLLHRAMPEIVHFFMYRNGRDTVNSILNVFVKNNKLFANYSYPKLLKMLLGFPLFQAVMRGPHNKELVSCFPSLMTWMWASHMRFYVDQRKEGIPIVGLRYEDLLQDPEAIFSQLLQICTLPKSLAQLATTALDEDSQRGLDISRKLSQTASSPVLPEYDDPDVKRRCDAICDLLEVPRLDQTDRLSATIESTGIY